MKIIIKGCIESPIARTIFIMLIGGGAVVFIPHYMGLTVIVRVLFPYLQWPWFRGLLCIISLSVVMIFIILIYAGVYNLVKENMEKKK
jgi:hypothetical protein